MWKAATPARTSEAIQLYPDVVIWGLQFFKEAPIFLRNGYKSYLQEAFTHELEVTCQCFALSQLTG